MQKKIIALAVAGLVSGAAFADSNVTVYGVADGTFDVISTSGAANGNNNTGSFNRVSSNLSWLGFRGAEDLGNGTKAIFQFESGVGFDSGGSGSGGVFSSTRESYVGLAGNNFGKVLLGTLSGPTRTLGVAMDVNTSAASIGYGAGLLGKLGNKLTGRLNTTSSTPVTPVTAACNGRSATCVSVFDNFQNNTVAYVSPNMSGFTLMGAYVANENKANNGAASQPNTSAYDLGATYANGPITIMATYADVKARDVLSTDAKDARLAGKYDFGKGDVRLVWDQTKGSTSAGDIKQTVWGIGGTLAASANGRLLAQYYKANDVSGAAALGAQGQTGAKMFEIGYEHSLSKRTLIKAGYTRLKNDTNAAYDYGINATGVSAAGIALSGFQVGVRHSF